MPDQVDSSESIPENIENSEKDNEYVQITDEVQLSKKQIKKVRKALKWEARKPEKRLRERLKAKERRATAKANNIDLGPSRKALKRSTMAESTCKLGVSIDMSFDELMISKDIGKLVKQILRCYTLNRRAAAPLQFSLTNLGGKSAEQMKKHNGYEHWDVKFHQESYLDLVNKENIIYLTSESENVIEELDHNCTYIIGGLVDHNGHKGICYEAAKTQGIRHGRLPLDKFLKMKVRKVLTVDHVFEILLRKTEGKTWQEVLLQVMPERKNAQLVENEEEHAEDETFETNGKEDILEQKNAQLVENEEEHAEDKTLETNRKEDILGKENEVEVSLDKTKTDCDENDENLNNIESSEMQ